MKQDVGHAGRLGVPRNIPCSTLFQPCSTDIDLVPFSKSAKKWNKVYNSTMAKAMASKQNARCRGGPWAPRTPACSSHNPLDHELRTLFHRDLGIKGLDTSFHRIGYTPRAQRCCPAQCSARERWILSSAGRILVV